MKYDQNYKDWKKGDKIVVRQGDKTTLFGVLLEDAQYVSTHSIGCFTAKIRIPDGTVSSPILNMTYLYRVKEGD